MPLSISFFRITLWGFVLTAYKTFPGKFFWKKTEALLTANANYADAVNSVASTEAAYLSAQESNSKLKNPGELEIQKFLRKEV